MFTSIVGICLFLSFWFTIPAFYSNLYREFFSAVYIFHVCALCMYVCIPICLSVCLLLLRVFLTLRSVVCWESELKRTFTPDTEEQIGPDRAGLEALGEVWIPEGADLSAYNARFNSEIEEKLKSNVYFIPFPTISSIYLCMYVCMYVCISG